MVLGGSKQDDLCVFRIQVEKVLVKAVPNVIVKYFEIISKVSTRIICSNTTISNKCDVLH